MRENESVYLPLGCVHRLANPGRIPVEIVEVQTGAYLEEDDIVRIEDDFGRLSGAAVKFGTSGLRGLVAEMTDAGLRGACARPSSRTCGPAARRVARCWSGGTCGRARRGSPPPAAAAIRGRGR